MDGIALMAALDGWSAWPAPAKLNLFLQIIGRRADGYHLLQTVFRLLGWGDTIHLCLRSDGLIRRVGDSLPGVAEDDDLVVRAARLLQSSTGTRTGAEIRVDKRIPAGGGFGGGSSDAATVLVALNALWSLGLPVDALAALGLQLGADVPVFVRGHNAWAEGVGEQLTPIALPPAAYLLVDPGVHVPTPALFQSQELTRDAAPVKIADFASGSQLDNAFEPVLRRREPAVEAVFQALSQIGTPRLTGSGSGCFVEFATRAAAEQALAQLPGSLRAWVVEGAAHSPLLDALDATTF
ncbi:4-(cytidine 5'-diphospho)-2-C-methyl-D-erythritol kinase [Xanthomonas vesicatoria]|uniref:4-(cytidine 5'-diphospho)-2-C-methyl-D-erythritol kinase n=1 Tax=Xanthomonas vesicatoria TaxID=56460 RepID=UPI0007321D73|nr:4-(cytidine 5'-diphospho)-2-C-methyl-D-erythritol kinase [Xanthomonas vesicatoria]KTF33197.1 kinase [Xanthomonas vesicatoria]MCC8557056.1 4-(cytidine 5'-diphospho)-2-C-methyl-D-erythritol kinase [Xanthomonas vesicatoria]MCC8602720.1 4-(cytidine 5'-diphospho)-2-C-methyl-D-erythritol kinase [Xanthomonas vesicatoria]MCC8609933.1 4-(cytidine 5'-diphospho)-2-C-methyl-D-erythritol kinase [Xanthomonas vesicatoria]MCC8672020.1 4-(cytidine 5'-diphospho)-2-C-methyl-D-erythritol kinase [Xanthomonas ve